MNNTICVWFCRVLDNMGHLAFSNSGINKVAMVKNALLPMSLYSLLCVNEIIRYHLHIVDRSTMCK